MELIEKINFEVAKFPNAKKIDSRQLPCPLCVEDGAARREMDQVQTMLKDNTNFAKELIATYHTILHTDIQSGLLLLYFKDLKNVMGIQVIAKQVDGRDGKGEENLIYKMCKDTISSR